MMSLSTQDSVVFTTPNGSTALPAGVGASPGLMDVPSEESLRLTMLEASEGSLMEIYAGTCATGESRCQKSN